MPCHKFFIPHDASKGSLLEQDVFLIIDKHLYLQGHKKERQELSNGKLQYTPVRPVLQTGQTGLSHQHAI
jgi:hypothetical protein